MISMTALEMLIPVFHEKNEESQTTISVWKNDPMQILLNSVGKSTFSITLYVVK